MPGTCVDDPAGQVNIDVAQDLDEKHNLNVRIEAASDAVTTMETDEYSLCNVKGKEIGYEGFRWADWPVKLIPCEKSLFTIGTRMCEGCEAGMWERPGLAESHHGNSAPAAQNHCAIQEQKQAQDVVASSLCAAMNVALADAAAACQELAGNDQFFKDCQIDYCASGGHDLAAKEAVEEEAVENPQPVCVGDGACDPANDCCNALRDQAVLTLDNVVSSEMCSGDGVRYASALTQNGQVMDLIVKPVGDFSCSGRFKKLDDSKFGFKNAQIGLLSVLSGTSQAFEFSFVQHGTTNPATPQNLVMSFLDIDQGKKGKQRESVEICDAVDAIVTDDTEIEVHVNGNCVKATSSTAGTRKDNPDNLEELSQLQRARSIAYKVGGSSFTATLSVGKGHHNPRRFQFAGHPTVACVLK